MGLLAAAAATVVAVAGCSGPLSGTPATGGGSVESSAPALPPRPQVVDLAGVDPCSLLTEQQQLELGTDLPPTLVDADRYGNPRCDFRKLERPAYGYRMGPVTQEDVSVYLTGARQSTGEVVSAAGFPAVAHRLPGDERACFASVSTKQGQYLTVLYSEGSGTEDPPAVVCEKARVAAAMATQTLLARR